MFLPGNELQIQFIVAQIKVKINTKINYKVSTFIRLVFPDFPLVRPPDMMMLSPDFRLKLFSATFLA